MSEDEYSYQYSDGSDNEQMKSDQDEAEFEYTDDEDEEQQEQTDNFGVNLENTYYNAKQLKDDAYRDEDAAGGPSNTNSTDTNVKIQQAIQEFEKAIQMEKMHLEPKIGSFTFKCLKQIVKIRMRRNEPAEAQIVYRRLLECISNPELEGVSPNAVEKGINGMLDRVSIFSNINININNDINNDSDNNDAAQGLARLVYDSTLSLFHPTKGSCPTERLWFKTNLKYGQLLYENHETNKLQSVIHDLLQTSGLEQSSAEARSFSNSTHLMEIYALQIQLYSRLEDNKMLREIFSKAMQVQGGIPHPRTLALIQELGGKMHMASNEYEAACSTFFQAFKSYDEAGDVARLRCLKYLVLASMLDASSINPFDSQEVRPYKKDPEIVAMTNLVDAFHSNNIKKFERILDKNEGKVMDDEFIREYTSDLRRTIRKQVLLQVVQPYTRISLQALAKELNGISIEDVESLLVPLILDGKLQGRIDQVEGILVKTVDFGSMSKASVNPAEDPSEPSDAKDGKDKDKEKKMSLLGANTITFRTMDAIENLMSEVEKLTSVIASSASQGPEKLQGNSEGMAIGSRG